MNENIGKLKSYILFLLLITSLIQAGILWSSGTQRISFNYVRNLFKSYTAMSYESDIERLKQYIAPEKLIIGSTNNYYLINSQDKEFQDIYYHIKENVRKGLKDNLPKKVDTDMWQEQIGRKGIYAFFPLEIPIELINGIFEINNTSTDIENIQKIAIIPNKDRGFDELEIFLKNKNGLWQYRIRDRSNIDDLLVKITERENETRYIENYNGMLKDLIGSLVKDIGEPDIIYNDRKPLGKVMGTYSITPLPFRSNEETLMNVIMENKQHLYKESLYDDNYIEYINSRNLYKLYIRNDDAGLVEYKYLGDNYTLKTGLSAAMATALGVLDNIKEYSPQGLDYRLDSIYETEKGYIFDFAYILDGIRLILNNTSTPEYCSIEIEGERIINYQIHMLRKQLLSEESYNVDYLYLFNEKIKTKNLYINDIELVYHYGSIFEHTLPYWRVEHTNDFNNYYEILKDD